MKVLQFIETGGPGGAEQVVLKLSKELIKRGDDVLVCTLREGWLTKELDRLKIRRIRLNSSRATDVNLIFQIAALCKREKVDVIHSHLMDSNFYCALSTLISRTRLICTEHGDIHHSQKKKLVGFKTKVISFLADKITAVSTFTKDELVRFGMKQKKIVVVRNPIELKPKSTLATHLKLQDISKKLHDRDYWNWVHVGNLRPVKDQATLLRGFAEALKISAVKQRLIIIGDGDLKNTLVELSHSLEIFEDVIFLGFRDDVADILPLCDGFILTSQSEAMPISILEAMRARLVVISSNVGGIPEIIKDHETGFVFKSQDYLGLAAKMALIAGDKKTANLICDAAEKEVLQECETSNITNIFKQLYQK